MKEYKCFKIGYEKEDTERDLNSFVKEGWKLICSYALHGNYLILERDKEVCKTCKK